MTSPRSVTRHQSVYRALLVLYPRSFRDRYGQPMAQLFGDRLRDVGTRAWLRTIADLLRTVPVERIEATMDRLRRSAGARVVALAVAVLGAALLVMGFGGGVAIVVTLAVVAILFAQRRLFASLPRGERAPLHHAVVQAWWAPIAALLGIAMLVAGIGTIFEAHNWAGRIVGSAVLMAFGAAMLFGLARRPFARQAGNSLILVATVPAFPFFWLIVPTVAAVVVWIGVLGAGFSDEPAASPARTSPPS
jgi:hypothetical protein